MKYSLQNIKKQNLDENTVICKPDKPPSIQLLGLILKVKCDGQLCGLFHGVVNHQ
jgi:hypothetical protein